MSLAWFVALYTLSHCLRCRDQYTSQMEEIKTGENEIDNGSVLNKTSSLTI